MDHVFRMDAVEGQYRKVNGQVEVRLNRPLEIDLLSPISGPVYIALVFSLAHLRAEPLLGSDGLKGEDIQPPLLILEPEATLDWGPIPDHGGLHFRFLVNVKEGRNSFSVLFPVRSSHPLNQGHLQERRRWTLTAFSEQFNITARLDVQIVSELRAECKKPKRPDKNIADGLDIVLESIPRNSTESLAAWITNGIEDILKAMSADEIEEFVHELELLFARFKSRQILTLNSTPIIPETIQPDIEILAPDYD